MVNKKVKEHDGGVVSTYYIDFYEQEVESCADWDKTDAIVHEMLDALRASGIITYHMMCAISGLNTAYLTHVLSMNELRMSIEKIEDKKDQIQECIEEDLCQKLTNN